MPARVTNFHRRLLTPTGLQRLRSLGSVSALPVAVVLLLAACASNPGRGWWGFTLGHPAQAAPTATAGETAAGSYLAGRAAIEAGDLHTAAEEYERALQADPGDIELRRQVFALLLASGDFERALDAAKGLVQADAGSDEAVLFVALDHARRGEDAKARDMLGKLGGEGLIGTVQPILLAWALYGAGQRQEALAALSSSDARSGLDRLRTYHRAVMLGLDGHPQQGLDALRTLFPDLATAPVRVIRTAVDLELAAGDRAAADKLVATARAADPDERQLEWLAEALARGRDGIAPVDGPASGMSDALTGIAEALSSQEGNAQAMLFARAASFLAPDDGETWLLIARIALDQNNPGEALQALDHVPADASVAWIADLTRARALQDLKRTDEAAKLLQAMADQAPTRSDALVALGDLQRGEENFADAEKAYTQALQRLPGIDRRNWRLLYARGICYERTGRWPEAEADLLKALELEPEQPFVLNYLGYSWVDKGLNLDRAKAMLHRAVELKPDDGFIVDSLGWAYFRLGDDAKAVTYLERAVELEPGDPVINDHLGDAYWRVGRTREAKFQWQRALTFGPEPDAVVIIQGKLQKGLSDAAKPG